MLVGVPFHFGSGFLSIFFFPCQILVRSFFFSQSGRKAFFVFGFFFYPPVWSPPPPPPFLRPKRTRFLPSPIFRIRLFIYCFTPPSFSQLPLTDYPPPILIMQISDNFFALTSSLTFSNGTPGEKSTCPSIATCVEVLPTPSHGMPVFARFFFSCLLTPFRSPPLFTQIFGGRSDPLQNFIIVFRG